MTGSYALFFVRYVALEKTILILGTGVFFRYVDISFHYMEF